MTDISIYTDRLNITLTEYAEAPFSSHPDVRFGVKSAWRDGAIVSHQERAQAYMFSGFGATREDAIKNFKRSVARAVERDEEARRQREIMDNPLSVERIEL